MQDKTLDAWVKEWADDVIRLLHRSDYPNCNAVERICRDPGIGTSVSQHRVLWFPRTRRISKISRAAHQLSPFDRVILIVNAGSVSDDEGGRLTPDQFCKFKGVKKSKYPALVNRAKNKLREILTKQRKEQK